MEKKQVCPHCEKRAKEEAKREEVNFAILVGLMPLMIITIMGNAGLFR